MSFMASISLSMIFFLNWPNWYLKLYIVNQILIHAHVGVNKSRVCTTCIRNTSEKVTVPSLFSVRNKFKRVWSNHTWKFKQMPLKIIPDKVHGNIYFFCGLAERLMIRHVFVCAYLMHMINMSAPQIPDKFFNQNSNLLIYM